MFTNTQTTVRSNEFNDSVGLLNYVDLLILFKSFLSKINLSITRK